MNGFVSGHTVPNFLGRGGRARGIFCERESIHLLLYLRSLCGWGSEHFNNQFVDHGRIVRLENNSALRMRLIYTTTNPLFHQSPSWHLLGSTSTYQMIAPIATFNPTGSHCFSRDTNSRQTVPTNLTHQKTSSVQRGRERTLNTILE